MTDWGNTQQAREAQHRNGQVAEVEPHVTHLLAGERELLAECHQCRTYLRLCGQMLPVSELQSSLCEPGCKRIFTYCPDCLHVAAQLNADAGLVWSPGLRIGHGR